MPSGSRNTGMLSSLVEGMDADMLDEQMLKAHFDAASQPAMGEALELFSFLGKLPDAFVASQQREAKRLQKLGRDKDPRLEALKVSVEEAERLRSTARWGQARFERAVAALTEEDDVFHGFISDADLRFQKGYTVRLVDDGDADGKSELSATTEADGYFSITLKVKTEKKAGGFPSREDASAVLGAGLSELFGIGGAAAAAQPSSSDRKSREVYAELFDPSGQRFHQDPVPIDLEGGSVYREYVVNGDAAGSSSQRYAGNPETRELHDTQKLTKRCNFSTINPDTLVHFDTTADAQKAGYDLCAHCFGKAKSKPKR